MRLHLIANSHIDPVWLWDKYEGIDEVLNTFRSACDRLDEYPELYFSASSLQFYAWCHEHDPALFARIRARVAEGRWEIPGGWWIEPDSNLPLAASVRKQHELSSRFLDDHFGGRRTEVAFLPDTFGHPATLPGLLAETGFKYFVFSRPGLHEKEDLPGNLFYWEYEGRRVLAYRLKHHYTQPRFAEKDAILARLGDPEYTAQPTSAFFFGVGNHGGGPTIAEIELYREFIGSDAGDAGFSTCAAFFAEAERIPGIPTYSGDLHRHAVGCYSVLRDLKQRIRNAEHGLEFAARAMAMVGTSPDALAPLWRKTLFNQFHDILPGSCSPAAADMARCEMGGVDDGWRTLAYGALKSRSSAQPVECTEGEFRVHNTLPYPVTAPLSIESGPYFVPDADFRNTRGQSIDIQEVSPSVRCDVRHWEFVDTLPARGCNTYHFSDTLSKGGKGPSPAHFVEGNCIENGRFTVAADGAVSGLEDETLLPGPRFLVLEDESDTWGHGVVSYGDVIGGFARESVAILTGPVTGKLYQRWTYGRSHLEVVYALYRNLPWVDLAVTVGWAEDRRILKMELAPVDCAATTCTMQGPGGPIERPADGSEQPLHHWVLLRGKRATFGLVQDGAFACDAGDGRLRINLVRSSIYGYHAPNALDPRDPQQLTDQGLHAFRFRLFFAETAKAAAEAVSMDRRADAFLEPFWVIRESGGRRPPS